LTSPDVVRRRLDLIEPSVGELRRLARPERLDSDLRERRFVDFRNVLVHGYADVDLGVVCDVVSNRLDGLLAFAKALRARLGSG
jgi:uncharacterized protein YutE (UPF0331/DUF86 family)